jgi:hypothetical protein
MMRRLTANQIPSTMKFIVDPDQARGGERLE